MPDPAPDAPKTDDAPKTTFSGDFDPERAARLIDNLRGEIADLKKDLGTARTALQEREDAEKSEAQKIADRAAAAEKAAADAKRALLIERATRKHSLPEDVVEFLTGDTEEEIEAKAARLASLGAPKKDGEETPPADLPGKPKADLVPGHGGEETAPFDPDAIAAAARR
jgi:hypothetical protein